MKNKNFLRLSLALLGISLVLGACHSKLDPFHDDSDGTGDGIVQTTGTGAADTNILNATQRRAASRNAAIVSAQFEMLTRLKLLRYGDGTTVDDRITSDASFETAVDNLIASSEIIDSQWANNDDATVTIQLAHSQIRGVVGNVTNL